MPILDEQIEKYELQPYQRPAGAPAGEQDGAELTTCLYSFRIKRPPDRFHYVVVAYDRQGKPCGIADGIETMGPGQVFMGIFVALRFQGLIHCCREPVAIDVRVRNLEHLADA